MLNLEEVKPLEEIRSMPIDEARKYLQELKDNRMGSTMRKTWKVTVQQYYSVMHEFGVELNPRPLGSGRKVKSVQIESPSPIVEPRKPQQKRPRKIAPIPEPIPVPAPAEVPEGFIISINKTMPGSLVEERFRLLSVAINTDATYKVKISLEEVETEQANE